LVLLKDQGMVTYPDPWFFAGVIYEWVGRRSHMRRDRLQMGTNLAPDLEQMQPDAIKNNIEFLNYGRRH